MGYYGGDEYLNFDEYGRPISTAGFRPQINGPQYGGLEYQNTPAPPMRSQGLVQQAASAAPMVANPALGIGLKTAGLVANWLGGSGDRKIRKQGLQRMNELYSKPSIDVNGLTAYRRRATLADADRFGQQADRAFGLDTGRGFGWMSHELLKGIDRGAAEAFYQNELETERKRLQIAMTQANWGR